MKQKDLVKKSEGFKKFCYVVLTLLVVVLTSFVWGISEFIGFDLYFPMIVNAVLIYIYVTTMSGISKNPYEITKAVMEIAKEEKRLKKERSKQ